MLQYVTAIPIGSMYGIFTITYLHLGDFWGKGKYSIHAAFGI